MKYIKLYEAFDRKKVNIEEGDKWFTDSRGDYLINTSTYLDKYINNVFRNLSLFYELSDTVNVKINIDDEDTDMDFYHRTTFNISKELKVIYNDYTMVEIEDHGNPDDEDGYDYNEYNTGEIDIEKNGKAIYSDVVASMVGYSDISFKKIAPVIDKILSNEASPELLKKVSSDLVLYNELFRYLSNKTKHLISAERQKKVKKRFL